MSTGKDAHSCIGCGRLTTAESQTCYRCMQYGRFKRSTLGSASASGPLTELYQECEYDYSENSLGPHTSDERWNWQWTDDLERKL